MSQALQAVACVYVVVGLLSAEACLGSARRAKDPRFGTLGYVIVLVGWPVLLLRYVLARRRP